MKSARFINSHSHCRYWEQLKRVYKVRREGTRKTLKVTNTIEGNGMKTIEEKEEYVHFGLKKSLEKGEA